MAVFHAHGTTVMIGSAQIKKLTTITLPERTRGEVNVTTGDSAGIAQYIPSAILEGGSLSLEFLLDRADAGQNALRTNLVAGTAATFTITLPSNGGTYTFSGFVTSLSEGELPQTGDEPATGSATIKVAGAVTVS